MRIGYVLEDAGLSGGARVVVEHCKRLAARGHEMTLFTVTQTDPRAWFDIGNVRWVPKGSYAALESGLKDYDGLKVATWWMTAPAVAKSGGRGFYLVQDIETSYVPDQAGHDEVLATYKLPLTKITESVWVSQQFRDGHNVGIGIDHENYKPSKLPRMSDTVLHNYRGHFLKGPELFVDAVRRLPRSMKIVTFGAEKPPLGRIKHRGFVTDCDAAGCYNESSVFLATSTHEGFGLPILEAMACGCPVVTTRADGNMEFCVDGLNCLVIDRDPGMIADAITDVCSKPDLAAALSREGLATARRYSWHPVIDGLEKIYDGRDESV